MLIDSCSESSKWWLLSPPGTSWQQHILVARTPHQEEKPLTDVLLKALGWWPLATLEPISLVLRMECCDCREAGDGGQKGSGDEGGWDLATKDVPESGWFLNATLMV